MNEAEVEAQCQLNKYLEVTYQVCGKDVTCQQNLGLWIGNKSRDTDVT
jgi:hypothetical protein